MLATFSPRNVSIKITLYETLICEAKKKKTYLARSASAEFPAGKRQPFIRISRKTLEISTWTYTWCIDLSCHLGHRSAGDLHKMTKLYTIDCLQEHLGQNLRTSHHPPKRKERKQNAKHQHWRLGSHIYRTNDQRQPENNGGQGAYLDDSPGKISARHGHTAQIDGSHTFLRPFPCSAPVLPQSLRLCPPKHLSMTKPVKAWKSVYWQVFVDDCYVAVRDNTSSDFAVRTRTLVFSRGARRSTQKTQRRWALLLR